VKEPAKRPESVEPWRRLRRVLDLLEGVRNVAELRVMVRGKWRPVQQFPEGTRSASQCE